MGTVKLANGYRTSLAADVLAGASSFVVTSATGAPTLAAGDWCYITIGWDGNNEIVRCTARSGTTWTGPVVGAWSAGTPVTIGVTAEALIDLTAGNAVDNLRTAIAQQTFVRLAAIGDSEIMNGTAGSGSDQGLFLGGLSLLVWAAALSGGCIAPIRVEGQGGQRTDQIRGLIPRSKASPVIDAVLVHCGTNDVGQDVATATIMGHLNGIYDDLIAAGKLPIAATLPPREADTQARINGMVALNRAIIANARARRIPVVDIFGAMVGPGYTWRNAAWHLPGDVFHYSSAGVLEAAKTIADCCMMLTGQFGTVAESEVPDQDYPSSIDLVVNSIFASGSTVPTGWTDWSVTNDISAVLAPGSDTDGVGQGNSVWKITVGSDGVTTYEMQGGQAFTLVPGHRYGFGCRMKIDRGAANGATNHAAISVRNAADVGNGILAGISLYGGLGDTANAPNLPAMTYYNEFVAPAGVTSGILYVSANGVGTVFQLANILLYDWTAAGY